jgi:ACT domain
MRVLDIGTFDGFYAFLAEHRGADRVVAVDNEQYRLWVASRWGVELVGGGLPPGLGVGDEREVIVVDVEDRPGTMAQVARTIADAGVNIELVYTTFGGVRLAWGR